jgi:hypothetical protein
MCRIKILNKSVYRIRIWTVSYLDFFFSFFRFRRQGATFCAVSIFSSWYLFFFQFLLLFCYVWQFKGKIDCIDISTSYGIRSKVIYLYIIVTLDSLISGHLIWHFKVAHYDDETNYPNSKTSSEFDERYFFRYRSYSSLHCTKWRCTSGWLKYLYAMSSSIF